MLDDGNACSSKAEQAGQEATFALTGWEREQERLEREAFLEGKSRLRALLKRAREGGNESRTAPGRWIIRRVIEPMAAMLATDFAQSDNGRATRGGKMLHVIKEMEPEFLCAVAARAAIDGAFSAENGGKRALTLVSAEIGSAIEEEWRWHVWKEKDAAQARAMREVVGKRNAARVQRTVERALAKRFGPEELKHRWDRMQIVALGRRFVDYMVHKDVGLFEETTGIFASHGRGKVSNPKRAIRLTRRVVQRAKEVEALVATTMPLAWPLVVPPRPWTAPSGGGFHFREKIDAEICPEGLKPLPLVRWAKPEQREALAKTDRAGALSTVYAGLNAAQGTAWRINARVYEVWAAMVEGNFGPTEDVIPLDNERLPEYIPDDLWEEMEEDARREHRQAKASVWERNRKLASKRKRQHRLKQACKRFSAYPAIYFAYNCDSRGRVYAASPDLSPQGSRIEKGLLEFAHGDELTDRGVYWLKVAAATYYGEDKISFDARARWAEENEELILSAARHPLDDERWWKADEKSRWQFLAACFAYQEWKQARERGDVDTV